MNAVRKRLRTESTESAEPPNADVPTASVALRAFALCPYAEISKPANASVGSNVKPTISLGAAGSVRALSDAANATASPRLHVGDEVWTRVALAKFEGAPSRLLANHVFTIPLGISLAQAATLGDSAMMALVALRDANVGAGTRVLVHGAANPFGHAVVALAGHLGALTVATIDHAIERDIAESSGATAVVSVHQRDALDRLRAASQGRSSAGTPGYDVIFDAAVSEHMELNIEVLAENGTIVTCPLRGRIGVIRGVEMLAEKNGQIRFATQSSIAKHEIFELGTFINGAIHTGRYRPLVGQVIGPGELDRALERLARGRTIGNVVLQTDFPAAASPVLRTYF